MQSFLFAEASHKGVLANASRSRAEEVISFMVDPDPELYGSCGTTLADGFSQRYQLFGCLESELFGIAPGIKDLWRELLENRSVLPSGQMRMRLSPQ